MVRGKAGPFAIQGRILHAPRRGVIEVFDDALVRVDTHGVISDVSVCGTRDFDQQLALEAREGRLLKLGTDRCLLPGMIDLHVHAPQWPQLGKALDLPLDRWLQEHTFPLEARYADLEFADGVYHGLVSSLLANGTTTAMYFGTVHLPATCRLAEICLHAGQRAFIGKVAMDNPAQCPDFYRDASTARGLDETREFISYVHGLQRGESASVFPVITPRFIPSCTDQMLAGLGRLAAESGCHVQTHCSESNWEHNYVLERHRESDTHSLDRFGLLTRQTVLAHCTLVDGRDLDLIGSRGSGIAHCPLSNFYFSDAIFPARRALDSGLHTGLGTDISGGPSPSLLHNCAVAVTASRALEAEVNRQHGAAGTTTTRIDFREAFWMATAGGAEVLQINAGRFEAGYSFDALIIDTSARDTDLNVDLESDSGEDVLQKLMYNGGRRNIEAVWVQGRQVAGG